MSQKYYLSQKATIGILRRALKRGKKLPDALRLALENQSGIRRDTLGQEEIANTGKILRELWGKVGAKTFNQWVSGVIVSFQQKKILRFELLCGVAEEAAQKTKVATVGQAGGENSCAERPVRELWEAGCEGHPPQKWRSIGQLAGQLNKALQEVSYQTAPAEAFVCCLRQACEGEESLRQSLSGFFASRETGQEAATGIAGSTGASGAVTHSGFNFEMYSGDCKGLAPALQARRAKDSLVYENHPNDSRVKGPLNVCEQLTARNGTGGGNLPLGQEAGQYWNGDDVAPTQDASLLSKQQMMPHKNRFNAIIEPIPIHDQATRHSGKRGAKSGGDVRHNPSEKGTDALTAHQTPAVQNSGMAVRRLTPTECLRLQGFPDNWTQIPWRNKTPQDCPDGPQYKAIGNSMAIPCVEFIARRIAEQFQEHLKG